MSELRFFFDVQCPFAYLGSTGVEALAARTGATLVWKPMLLGGLFYLIGRGKGWASPSQVRYTAMDIDRWRKARGLPPITFVPGHPRKTVDAMRLCVAAGDEKVAPVMHALYRAYFVEGRDVEDRAVVDEIARAHGIDPARIDADETKATLRANTDEAAAEGIFGAPSFVVVTDAGKHMFWGQDRMHFVEKALTGWKVPA